MVVMILTIKNGGLSNNHGDLSIANSGKLVL